MTLFDDSINGRERNKLDALHKPKRSIQLAAFDVRMLNQIGQRVAPARTA